MDDFNWMMARATALYNQVPEALGPRDLGDNRVQVAEALVGQWIERTRRWRRLSPARRTR